MRYAENLYWLNFGKGFTLKELETLVEECEEMQESIDDVLGDGAASTAIIKSLVKALKEDTAGLAGN